MHWLDFPAGLQSEYTVDLSTYYRRIVEQLFYLQTVRPGTLGSAGVAVPQGLTFAMARPQSEDRPLPYIGYIFTAVPCSRYAAC